MASNTLQKNSAIGTDKRLICRPLDTFADVACFLNQPPAWRTLCKELTPHSKNKLKNIETIYKDKRDIRLEAPATFCHYDPDAEDAVRYDENTLPRTLVCHDMANGYHDDSYIEGTANHSSYTFYNWAAIDIFCYFSHHFITIPPLSWINVAHQHGVQVIGTVITEWNEGVEMWDKILSSEAEATNFASTLVTIASTLKFDGWLLNVENKIGSPDTLLYFVNILRGMIHKELEHGILIWYDSVTVKGNLNWQNRLNEKNKAFFDACDGIFTNYSWDEQDLQGSVEMAGDRIRDLYIGVDIWGRNFYGGGHLNTQEAVAMIYRHGCSMALFAPAWTHEALSMDSCDINGVAMAEGFDKCALFYLRDRALWGSLWPFLSTRAPCQLPFRTSFCRGMGRQRRMYGEVLCNAPWFNLRHQQYQPNAALGPHGYRITSFEVTLRHAHESNERQKGILRRSESLQSASCLKTKESIVNPNSDKVEACKHEVPGSSNHQTRARGASDTSVKSNIEHNNMEQKHVQHQSGIVDLKKAGSDEDENMKNVRRTSSGPTLLQNVKRVLMKLKHPKSVPELNQSNDVAPTQSQSQSSCDRSSNDSTPKASKTSLHRESNKQRNKGLKAKDSLKLIAEALHSEAQEGLEIENKSEASDELMEAGASVPLVAQAPGDKSMLQMSVKIHLSTRKRTVYGLSREPGELECLELWLQDSFNGGACLRIHASDEASPTHRYTRLFHCDFLCEPVMLVCVVTKAEPPSSQSLNILLKMENVEGAPLTAVVIGRELPQVQAQEPAARGSVQVAPLDAAALEGLRAALLLQRPDCYVPLQNDFGWKVRYYRLALPGCRITSVCCHALKVDEPILLGHFAIIPLKMD